MSSGYDQFFKNAKKSRVQASGAGTQGSRSKMDQLLLAEIEKMSLNPARVKDEKRSVKKKKRKPFPWKLAGLTFVSILLVSGSTFYLQQVEGFLERIEISFFGKAGAEGKPSDADGKSQKASASKDKVTDPKDAASKEKEKPTGGGETKKSDDDLDHIERLAERKTELDSREEELNRQEQALQKQREEIEKRMLELESVRKNISTVLDDRVKIDDAKVENLVQTISNMKSAQAAKMLEDMDEGLAVEIIGRMKKKNAAEIMNLVKTEKGRVLFEKYAGYKRK